MLYLTIQFQMVLRLRTHGALRLHSLHPVMAYCLDRRGNLLLLT